MASAQKLYNQLDSACEEFRKGLLAEFQNKDSWYLGKKLRDDKAHREFHISGLSSRAFEDANALLCLEKEIIQLCQKLKEPLPPSFQVIDEYVENYHRLQKGRNTCFNRSFAADDKHLRRTAIQLLS